jgi:uncharacterized Zn finger protein
MSRLKLTESIIQAAATPESFQRGREYFEAGAIFNVAIQGDVLLGECEGSSAPAYQVRVQLDSAGIQAAECTCPYDWGGFCKHIVALLLAYLHNREQFVERAQPAELLADLDRDDLVTLLEKLMQEQPGLYDRVAAAIAAPPKAARGQAKRRKAVDLDIHRRRVIGILHSLDGMRASEAYWQVGSLVKQLAEVQAAAMSFLEAGDPQSALDILLVLLEEAGHGFEYLDDSDGDLGGFVARLGEPLAEAVLSLEITTAERDELVQRLIPLHGWLANYGLEGSLGAAIEAAEHGWDLPADSGSPGQPANTHSRSQGREGSEFVDGDGDDEEIGGDFDEDGLEDDEYEGEAHIAGFGDLTDVKLNILDRRGHVQAYLQLCLAAGRHLRYALKLVDLGRTAAAVKHAQQKLSTAGEALALAEHLRASGHVAEAIEGGERGLKPAAPRYALASWLAPVEEAQ